MVIPIASASKCGKGFNTGAEGTTGSRRALTTGASFQQSGMTPQICQSFCGGFKYAGLEYGVECYCGNTLTNNGATGAIVDSNKCNMNCGGDSSQKCGAGWMVNVYSTS